MTRINSACVTAGFGDPSRCGTGRCLCHACPLHWPVHRRKPAKSGSSPPSDRPDTDSARLMGNRNAAASGGGHLYRSAPRTSLTPPSGPVVNGECSLSSRKLSRRRPAAWWETIMPEFKFSCPQCGQHLSGNEQWSGHQIQCPTCAMPLTVPQAPAPLAAAAPVPQSLVPQPPASHGAKLSAGATQVTRSTVPGPIPRKQIMTRPPRNNSPLLKYAGYAVVLAALGWAGYTFVPPWLSKIQDGGNSKPTQGGPAANSGGSGPLGEVNGAMDVSDTLDGGSSSQPRPAAARPPAAAQTPTTPAARPAASSTNDATRVRSRKSGQTGPDSAGHR
jgi:hypothetical protein